MLVCKSDTDILLMLAAGGLLLVAYVCACVCFNIEIIIRKHLQPLISTLNNSNPLYLTRLFVPALRSKSAAFWQAKTLSPASVLQKQSAGAGLLYY